MPGVCSGRLQRWLILPGGSVAVEWGSTDKDGIQYAHRRSTVINYCRIKQSDCCALDFLVPHSAVTRYECLESHAATHTNHILSGPGWSTEHHHWAHFKFNYFFRDSAPYCNQPKCIHFRRIPFTSYQFLIGYLVVPTQPTFRVESVPFIHPFSFLSDLSPHQCGTGQFQSHGTSGWLPSNTSLPLLHRHLEPPSSTTLHAWSTVHCPSCPPPLINWVPLGLQL